MAAPWTPRQQTPPPPPRNVPPFLDEDDDQAGPALLSRGSRRSVKRNVGGNASSSSVHEDYGDKSEEMWWRSDSSLDGRELDDLDIEEDPFYDPHMDEKDAKWAAKLRGGRQSDAILNCPGCFTTLCIDCQEHSSMVGCFRAMFVMNCRVDVHRRRGFRESMSTGKRNQVCGGRNADARVVRRKLDDDDCQMQRGEPGGGTIEGEESGGLEPDRDEIEDRMEGVCMSPAEDSAKPVVCNLCGTEVAAYDSDEVYHFFNVFPSLA